jgi:uncharacterized protein YcfL
MKNKSLIKWLLIPLALLTLASCAANQELRESNLGKHAQFVLMPPQMDYIKVERTAASKVNKLLSVQVTLQNITNQDNGISYRFKWFDANKLQVGDEESWKIQPIRASQFQTIKGQAMKEEISSFLLELR